MQVLGMISKIISTICILICFPIIVSGNESQLKQSVVRQKKFTTATEFHSLLLEQNRQIYSFKNQTVLYFAVQEKTETKSGTITYLALYDQMGKIVSLSIPAFENKHNASLTAPGFMNQFKNKQPAIKPIRRGDGVDAISGATLSTESLITAVNRTAKTLHQTISNSLTNNR